MEVIILYMIISYLYGLGILLQMKFTLNQMDLKLIEDWTEALAFTIIFVFSPILIPLWLGSKHFERLWDNESGTF